MEKVIEFLKSMLNSEKPRLAVAMGGITALVAVLYFPPESVASDCYLAIATQILIALVAMVFCIVYKPKEKE